MFKMAKTVHVFVEWRNTQHSPEIECMFAHLILMKVLSCCCLVAKSLPTLLQPHGL